MNPQETEETKMRTMVKSRSEQRQKVKAVFGSATDRFSEYLTPVPGVGRYNLEVDGESNLLKKSPSISKRGYVASFVSKAPKLSFIEDKGTPGPCSYDIYQGTLSVPPEGEGRPMTAFIPSGNGRVPFPPPNKVPGPAAYHIHPDPGTSPLLRYKPSATFESKSKRESFIQINDVPSAAKYKPHLVSPNALSSPPRRIRTMNGDLAPPPGEAPRHTPGSPIPLSEPKIPLKGDIVFYKSTYTRFQDIGKDNKVPGPQQYFTDSMEEDYFPEKTLRSCGTYHGKYVGKLQSEKRRPPHTFGADLDRFKDSVYGRLDLKAQIPGPGTYFDDLNFFSSINAGGSPTTSPRRMSPVKSTRNLEQHTYREGNSSMKKKGKGSTKSLNITGGKFI